jgi:hypothetical protein
MGWIVEIVHRGDRQRENRRPVSRIDSFLTHTITARKLDHASMSRVENVSGILSDVKGTFAKGQANHGPATERRKLTGKSENDSPPEDAGAQIER